MILNLILVAFLGIGFNQSYAQGIVAFGPKETRIEGSIPYSVIGKYQAHFKAFKGRIVWDDHFQQIQSVFLDIKAGSITSNCPWCDKIVKSRRLLNTLRYPDIIFKSNKIIRDSRGYRVKGVLEMHGIKRDAVFPFHLEISQKRRDSKRLIDLQGTWVINRKDYNIIWNSLLDHGGGLVGDELTVNWGIKMLI